VHKNLFRLVWLLLTATAIFSWGCGKEENQLALIVPVQVPEAAVTDHSALLTWYWPSSRNRGLQFIY